MSLAPEARIVLRSLAMIAGAVALFVLARAIIGGGTRLWMAPVIVAVALVARAAWDLWELDALLAASLVGALVLAAIAAAAWSNATAAPNPGAIAVPSPEELESLRTRALLFATGGAIAALAATWRLRAALRTPR